MYPEVALDFIGWGLSPTIFPTHPSPPPIPGASHTCASAQCAMNQKFPQSPPMFDYFSRVAHRTQRTRYSFCLLGYQFITKGCIGHGVGKEHRGFHAFFMCTTLLHQPRLSWTLSFWAFMEASLQWQDWLNYWTLKTVSTSSPSPFLGGGRERWDCEFQSSDHNVGSPNNQPSSLSLPKAFQKFPH